MKKICGSLICFFACFQLAAATIKLHTKDATVWLPEQIINGEIEGFSTEKIVVYINDSSFTILVKNNRFSFSILLKKASNLIWAEALHHNQTISSDTIKYQLGYTPLPVAVPFATVKKNVVQLHANIISNPYNFPLRFIWNDDKRNPSSIKIKNKNDSVTTFVQPSKQGDYFFNLTVIAGNDSAQYQTAINKSENIHCFNINNEHAAWIDSCIIYEISPAFFVKNANYDDITNKLAEIKSLGINTIYLQPLLKTHDYHQGYDVTDYFSLRDDLGTEQQLQHLIITAKALRLRVIFDFVPNHTSIYHPYAQDCLLNDSDSHYYNFYQRKDDGAKYSSLYQKDSSGFYHYFWPELINLNYQNKEVQQWITEACKYWLKKFDLDGFRFDAMWALNARAPYFGTQLQQQLKSIKPDILLLSEDKGANENAYAGYDAAYDWQSDTNWISHWSWQYDYAAHDNLTIFNYKDEDKRGEMLRKALFTGDSTHIRLHFMENNDLPRFIIAHGLQRTKMVATLMFALPGIPFILNGQEINCSKNLRLINPVFKTDKTIKSLDSSNMFSFYKKLANLRMQYNALRSNNMSNLSINSASSVVALKRWSNDETFVIIINMSSTAQQVSVDVNNINTNKNVLLTDVISNENFSSKSNKLNIKMKEYSTRLLLVKNVSNANK